MANKYERFILPTWHFLSTENVGNANNGKQNLKEKTRKD